MLYYGKIFFCCSVAGEQNISKHQNTLYCNANVQPMRVYHRIHITHQTQDMRKLILLLLITKLRP